MPNSRSGPSRRSLLASTAVAATATAGGMPLLSACGSDSSGEGGRASEEEVDSLLPAYRASDVSVQPDVPSKYGSSPGYTTFVAEGKLDTTVTGTPGSGSTFRVMSPLWGSAPRNGNDYWTAMDEAIGVHIDWETQDGNTYGDKISAVLAGSDIPDLVAIPSWELEGQMHQAIESRFADLGPYLSGDTVLDYPNLAAIPTGAWEASIFSDALRGLPMHSAPIGSVVPYYREDLFEQNGWSPPTSCQELLDWAKDVTSAKNRVWACDDLKWSAFVFFAVLPSKPSYWKKGDNGKLINRYETDEWIEALEWTRKLYQADVVHPDAKAATGDGGARFTSGETLLYNTGSGSWYSMAADQKSVNPDFTVNAFDFFSYDGGDPVIFVGNEATIWCFVNKDLAKDRIREALEIANYCAAPYGSVENRLRTYGVEGVHYTIEDGLPVRTQQGENEVVPDTYTYICSPRSAIVHPDIPQQVKDEAHWQQRQLRFRKEPLFLGAQIAEPSRLANLSDGFEELEDDFVRGRKSVRDLHNAVDDWRRDGGNELRDWYQKLLEEEEEGA